MVDTAVLVLHGKHPVQIVAHFFEDLGILRKFTRNIPGQRIQVLREILVGLQQCKHGDAGVHDILAVVARIVPATVGLNRLAGALAARHLVRAVDNHLVVLMAHRTRPLACIFRRKRHARTLVIEPLEGCLHEVVIDVLSDDNRGTHIFAPTEQAIRSRSLQRRNIESLHFFATVIPVIDHRGFKLQYGLSVQITHLEAVRVTTGVNDNLFGIGRKTQLVYKGARKSRRK